MFHYKQGYKIVLRSVLIFFVSYISLTLILSIENIHQYLRIWNASFGEVVFNAINPELTGSFAAEAKPNPYNFDFTFNMQTTSRPIQKQIIFQDHWSLFVVPHIFFISLLIATPLSVKQIIQRLFVGVGVLYIFISIRISYIFELVFSESQYQIDSLWSFVVWIFGLGGKFDTQYIFVACLWLLLSTYPLIETYIHQRQE